MFVIIEWQYVKLGFPGGTSGKESACQCGRHKRCKFNPWVGKIPWRRAWQPLPVFLPVYPWTEEPGGLQPMGSHRVGHDWSNFAHTLNLKVNSHLFTWGLLLFFNCLGGKRHFVHPSIHYLFNDYSVVGIILGTENTKMRRILLLTSRNS